MGFGRGGLFGHVALIAGCGFGEMYSQPAMFAPSSLTWTATDTRAYRHRHDQPGHSDFTHS